MYYFNPEENGRVKALYQPKEGGIEGFLATEAVPEIPDFGEGFTAQLYYLDGELVWKPAEMEEPENPEGRSPDEKAETP